MHARIVFDFNFEEAEERASFQNLTHSDGYYQVLQDFKEVLRHNKKYKELNESQYDLLEHLSQEFFQLLEDNRIVLE
jgi:hypothetical protein